MTKEILTGPQTFTNLSYSEEWISWEIQKIIDEESSPSERAYQAHQFLISLGETFWSATRRLSKWGLNE